MEIHFITNLDIDKQLVPIEANDKRHRRLRYLMDEYNAKEKYGIKIEVWNIINES